MVTISNCGTNEHLASLFNNEKFSDFQIVFPNSQTVLYLHQVIITQSPYFDTCINTGMIEAKNSKIELEDDEEEEVIMTALMKSFYTGDLVIPDDTDAHGIVAFLLLADKYQVLSVIPSLINELLSCLNISNVLACLDLNLDDHRFLEVKQRFHMLVKSGSDVILNACTFLNLNIEKWITVLNMIADKNNVLFTLDAVHKWIEYDEQNRIQYSHHLTGIVRKQSITSFSHLLSCFDPSSVANYAALSRNNTRIRNTSRELRYVVLGTKCDQFSIRLIRNCTNLKVGYMCRSHYNNNEHSMNDRSYSWFFNSNRVFEHGNKMYTISNSLFGSGNVITARLFKGTLSFMVNGDQNLLKFSGVIGDDLCPAFELSDVGCEFEFCDRYL